MFRGFYSYNNFLHPLSFDDFRKVGNFTFFGQVLFKVVFGIAVGVDKPNKVVPQRIRFAGDFFVQVNRIFITPDDDGIVTHLTRFQTLAGPGKDDHPKKCGERKMDDE